MPIYAYKCGSCGHAKDVLQKLSDAPLSQCPSCGAEAFSKQLTAAGFQLKGSGWYVTDFRGGDGKAKDADKSGDAAKTGEGTKAGESTKAGEGAKTGESAKSVESSKPADTGGSATKSDSPAASAGGCGATRAPR